jgi:hypothetical protein
MDHFSGGALELGASFLKADMMNKLVRAPNSDSRMATDCIEGLSVQDRTTWPVKKFSDHRF